MNLYSIHLTAEHTAGFGTLSISYPGSFISIKPEHPEQFVQALRQAVGVDEREKEFAEAIKKQIPLDPVGDNYQRMRCPSCNHRIPSGTGSSSHRRDNWCNYCGQKIKWEVKE